MEKVDIGNNTTLYTHPLNVSFYEFMKKWKTPEFQRKINQERVNSMIEKQKENFQLGGVFELCRLNKELFIVDGQHRKEMLTHFFEKNQFFTNSAVVRIKELENQNEMFDYFQFVNESTPVEYYEKSKCYKQVQFVFELIHEKWKDMITKNENHQCHKIHLVRFGNFLTHAKLLKEDWDKQETENLIHKLNQKFETKTKFIKMTKKQLDSCKENNFYLGLYIKFGNILF